MLAKDADGDLVWNELGAFPPEGEQGEQGIQGPAGPQGIQGPRGYTGATGATGPMGPIGETGETGAQGIQGPQGPKGDPGTFNSVSVSVGSGTGTPTVTYSYDSETGAATFTFNNLKGPKGDTGAQGPQGIQGIQGIQGPVGEKGDQGIQGVPGPQGEQGPQGPQGPAGVNAIYVNGETFTALGSGVTIPDYVTFIDLSYPIAPRINATSVTSGNYTITKEVFDKVTDAITENNNIIIRLEDSLFRYYYFGYFRNNSNEPEFIALSHMKTRYGSDYDDLYDVKVRFNKYIPYGETDYAYRFTYSVEKTVVKEITYLSTQNNVSWSSIVDNINAGREPILKALTNDQSGTL